MISQKKELRKVMRTSRAEAYKNDPRASLKLRDCFLDNITLPKGKVIAGYSPITDEMDPLPLMEALYAQGNLLALPVVGSTTAPLSFRPFKPGDLLTPTGKKRIHEPAASLIVTDPDIFLVPLLAFDMEGYRLGQGGGYFDRTLNFYRAQKDILAIGLAFDCQRIDAVPHNDSDAKLDKIVTENEAFEILKFC